MPCHLAIDLGASNGRVFLGRFQGRAPELTEAYRFANAPLFQDGHWRWDWPRLRSEVRAGLWRAAELAGGDPVISLGCSSWAQDFVLLDAGGQLLENPICYRDELTRGIPEVVADVIAPAELVQRVGGWVSPISLLCKLKALQTTRPQLLREANVLLHMADMVHFDLCGVARTDWTLASAGRLFNIRQETWDGDLLARLGIPAHILPPVVARPQIIGRVTGASSPHPKLIGVPVISTAHHDTACATVCFRPLATGVYFICLGSYAMAGCVAPPGGWPAGAQPGQHYVIGIADRQWGLFGSCAGMWIIQECMRCWQANGLDLDAHRLAPEVARSVYQGVIELGAPRFTKPADMVMEIQAACREQGLREPREPGDVAKLVFDSLAAGFAKAVRGLAAASGRDCATLHLAGGGVRNQYLVRQIAERIGCQVAPGPAEATATGNLTLQYEVLGQPEVR